MRQRQAIRYSFICLSLMVVAGYVVGAASGDTEAAKPNTTAPSKVVATVNGKPIYEDQLTPYVERDLKRFKKFGMREPNPDLVARLRKKILDMLIGNELIYQESQKLTVDNIEAQVDQKLASLESKYGAGEPFKKHLDSQNTSVDDLRASLRARVLVDEYLRQQGISEPEIAEERIRRTYENNLDDYSRDETIQVSHILIGVDGKAGPQQKDQARQTAEKIYNQVLEGKDFAEMAKRHSDCNSASGGGSLGYLKKGYMPKEFDSVAFRMEPGAVSNVVETKFGYHIIKVFDRKPGGITPYEEVRPIIKKSLQQEESPKKLAEQIAELKKRAKVEILLDES